MSELFDEGELEEAEFNNRTNEQKNIKKMNNEMQQIDKIIEILKEKEIFDDRDIERIYNE